MDTFELNRLLAEDDFSMIYRGEFNDEMTYELMEIQNSGISDKKAIRKRLSYLVIKYIIILFLMDKRTLQSLILTKVKLGDPS